LSDLLKDAKERALDKSCFQGAEAKKAAEMIPLVAAREQAAARIEHATQALGALEPVLSLVKDRVEKLRAHIDDDLTPECAEASEVSKALGKVRELILELEECPGRSDFKLKVPAKQAKSDDSPVTPPPKADAFPAPGSDEFFALSDTCSHLAKTEDALKKLFLEKGGFGKTMDFCESAGAGNNNNYYYNNEASEGPKIQPEGPKIQPEGPKIQPDGPKIQPIQQRAS